MRTAKATREVTTGAQPPTAVTREASPTESATVDATIPIIMRRKPPAPTRYARRDGFGGGKRFRRQICSRQRFHLFRYQNFLQRKAVKRGEQLSTQSCLRGVQLLKRQV